VIIVFVGSSALSTMRLDGRQWAISILLGALSLPIAILIRLIPDDFIRGLLPSSLGKHHAPPLGVSQANYSEWNDALADIRDQLTLFKRVRGGRFSSVMYAGPAKLRRRLSLRGDPMLGTPNSHTNGDASSPHRSLGGSRPNSVLGPATVMAGIVAGSIAGWSPMNHGTEPEPNETTRLLG
jgi:Ca2+-transporting ATPase